MQSTFLKSENNAVGVVCQEKQSATYRNEYEC